MEKWKIHVIEFMFMLTRSSERIFNPMRYTGCIYDYAHSFFGEDYKLECELSEIHLRFPSNWKEYDRGDMFPFDYKMLQDI